ncbi:IS1380 family transposase [candidate division KSB1 bacterium]|nr:IS1380 family transposase [candidate division KSB1 bacterium]
MKENSNSHRINKIEETSDNITGRGGISFFVRYLTSIGIYSLLLKYFAPIRKSKKGLPTEDIFKQVFSWFFDGTSRHLSYFDELARDEGYAGAIEQAPENMASSHTIKRFFKSITIFKVWLFRKVLTGLFLWRLKIKKPQVIYLDIDTMVMNNDDALVREGVGPTYKKKKGFQPLQVTWERFIIDAVFRGGVRHSNYEDTVVKTITHLVNLIRKRYRKDAIIVLHCDSGFFDQKNLEAFEKLGIFYICGARITDDIKKVVQAQTEGYFQQLKNKKQTWRFFEFGFKYGTWKEFRRFIFCQPLYKDQQMLLSFARAETLLVTNIRSDTVLPEMPKELHKLLNPKNLISKYHSRGANELVHRSLKDFGFEQLPFKRFTPNAALYYTMLVSFFLFETFKEDVLAPVIPIESYACSVRRKFLDIAAKVVSHSHEITLKFTSFAFQTLKLSALWNACHTAPCLI